MRLKKKSRHWYSSLFLALRVSWPQPAVVQWCLVLEGSPREVPGICIIMSRGDSRSRVRSSGSTCTLVVYVQAFLWSPYADHLLSWGLFPHLYPLASQECCIQCGNRYQSPSCKCHAHWLSTWAVGILEGGLVAVVIARNSWQFTVVLLWV